MNMMILQRYKNELIILVTLLFLIFSAIYKYSAAIDVNKNKRTTKETITQINHIGTLKKQWGGKQLANKVKVLQTVVPNDKVVLFQKKSKKLTASYKNLTGTQLSTVTNKLINIPVQITHLDVQQSAKNLYTMEFTCKW